LSFCLDYARVSEGAFDISLGPLIKTWGFHRGRGRRPDDEEVQAAVAIVGYRRVHLNTAARTVEFEREGMEIDLGGIGKGYAVDRVVDILRRNGFDTALVAGSGSSIYGMGSPPGEVNGWPVDIRDPRNPRETAASLYLKDMSLSTSGCFEKSFWTDNRIYSHILDPRTGYPAQGALSVSVVSPRTLDGEAWTKPCFILGRKWAQEHAATDFHIFYCEDQPGGAYEWIRWHRPGECPRSS
jgi:thiamine biosynthesis lipoprotein